VTSGSVRLTFESGSTRLEMGSGEQVELAVGPQGLAAQVLLHDPPTPLELEQAIDLIEDALMASKIPHATRADLLTAEELLIGLLSLASQGTRLSREEVEWQFEQLAARSLAGAPLRAGLPEGREAAAALVILREVMHHLGFQGLCAVSA